MLVNHKSTIFELENLKNENGALKRAVESKSVAIGILRSELEECQRERDEFRMMAETHPVSQPCQVYKPVVHCPEKTHSAILSGSENTLAQLLSQSKEENKQIRQELTDLRCRLHDAQSDLKILRAEKSQKCDAHQSRLSIATSSQLAQQERESHIQELEQLSSKCHSQEADLRCLLEEREELITERDELRHKLHRLNHVLNVLLSQDYLQQNNPRLRTVNLDAIITENRYLQQRMKQLEEEKCIAIAKSHKYKSALENCSTNTSALKLGRVSEKLIMSPKQVSEILNQHQGELGGTAEKDLKFLCLALVDSLNQKSKAVKSQKAANKMLIERVSDLERRLCYDEENDKQASNSRTETTLVSAFLLENYNPSSVGTVDSSRIASVLEEIEKIEKERSCLGETKSKQFCGVQPDDEIPLASHSCPPVLSRNYSSSPVDTVDSSGKSSVGKHVCEAKPNEANPINSNSSPTEHSSEVGPDVRPGRSNDIRPSNDDCYTPPLKNGSNSEQNLSSSDTEEIVPLEHLDSYISNLKQKRGRQEPSKPAGLPEGSSPHVHTKAEGSTKVGSEESPDASFDIDISDYDSDNDNLDTALQNWQSEFEKSSCSKGIAKLSPKRLRNISSRMEKIGKKRK